MPNFEFHSPLFLILFLFFIPLIFRDLKKKKRKSIPVPSIEGMKASKVYRGVDFFLKISKYFILFLLIIAMARPRTYISKNLNEEGIDIVLSVDISLSMLARDFEPDRLSALKNLSQEFVNQRENDRIGLVIYAGEAFMKVPLTSDHQVVSDEIHEMQPGDVQHGTAIGEGLAVATKHLIHSKAKSKIIILMTDGVNTLQNAINPEEAVLLARNNNIKVYTIGIGTNGYAESPAITPFGDIIFVPQQVEIDEETLSHIAKATGGKYFRATSNDGLEQIYQEINQLEKSEVKTKKIFEYKEYFRMLLWWALILLLLDAVLRWWIFKKI
ncbi:MAG: VWA domain-containing protein [Flavobacteriaceae bacterium]|nr:VWA domain-containing protein [Flavobacteriaceae bacterium]